jgi:tetratricopeptide (TPR) repeat protein
MDIKYQILGVIYLLLLFWLILTLFVHESWYKIRLFILHQLFFGGMATIIIIPQQLMIAWEIGCFSIYCILGLIFTNPERKLTEKIFKLEREQKYYEALTACNLILKFLPKDCFYWYKKGILLFTLGNYYEAVDTFTLAYKYTFPFDHIIRNLTLYYQALALHKLNNYSQSLINYERILTSNFYIFYMWKLETLIFARNETNPKYVLREKQVWNSRGLALAHLGSYNRALKSQPNFGEAFYNKPCTYAVMGEVRLALDSLQQAIDLNPQLYIQQARQDSHFELLNHLERFQILINTM